MQNTDPTDDGPCHFYLRLLWRLPVRLVETIDKVLAIIGVIAFALLLFNKPAAGKLMDWDGISPWYAVVPIGILWLYSLLRANYDEFLVTQQGALDAERTASQLRSELELMKAAQPIIALGDPVDFPNETLERTHMVNDPSWSSSVSNPPQTRVPLPNVPVLLFRIPVHNSGASAPSVCVKLIETSPPMQGGLPTPTLHLAGDNPQDHVSYSRSGGFHLPRDATEHIDVIAMEKTAPHKCFIWSIASPDAVQEMSLNGVYTFTIQAFAGNSPSEPRQYGVEADTARGTLIMRSLSSPNELGSAPERA